MSDSEKRLVSNLTAHVFGQNDPGLELVNHGQFPANWLSKYLSLLESISNVFRDRPEWPREVVAAVHFASFYLHARYDTWKTCGQRREKTEEALWKIRGASEAFLLASVTQTITVTPED